MIACIELPSCVNELIVNVNKASNESKDNVDRKTDIKDVWDKEPEQ